MLARKYRLHLDKDIQSVFKKGQIYFSPFFNLKILKNNLTTPRFCIMISTNISKKAVIRNKTKRQIRAIIKKNLTNISPGYDIIILAKPAIAITAFQKFNQTFVFLLTKAKIYQTY